MNLIQSLQTPTPWMKAPQLLGTKKVIPSFQTPPPTEWTETPALLENNKIYSTDIPPLQNR